MAATGASVCVEWMVTSVALALSNQCSSGRRESKTVVRQLTVLYCVVQRIDAFACLRIDWRACTTTPYPVTRQHKETGAEL